MLSSITPLGERAKGNRYGVTVLAHVVGSVAGGATTGVVLGLMGTVLAGSRSSAAAALATAVVCAIAATLEVSGRRLPSWRRQVNEQWLDEYRGVIYGFGYGYQLGMGIVTIVTSPATYAALACAVLAGSFTAAVVIGVAFGATRGLLVLTAARLDTPEELRRFHRRLAAGAPRARVATQLSLAATAAVLVAGAMA